MKLHYLFSDRKQVQAAIIHFNGERQHHCVQVDDVGGFIIRRKFQGGQIIGLETLQGTVTIEIPAVGKKPAYKTPEKETP